MYVGSFFYSIILVVFYVNSFASSFGSERDDRVDVSAHITLPTAITLREEILEKGFKDCLVQIRQLVATHPIQHCFLSYVNEDPDMLWMRRIESYLREVGVQSTYDMRVLGVGDSIMDFIQTVREAHYAIVLFSPRYLINFERGTYIRTEADEILEKWRNLEGFVIPLLLAERPNCSIPLLMNRRPKDPLTAVDPISAESSDQQPEGLDTLYIPLTKGSDLGDFEESLECVFRILKERIFKGVIGADASSERDFDRIKQRFYIKRDKLPQLTQCTELTSAYGTFPQSLKVHKAFLDRLNETGESYVYTIFEQLFMDESNEYGFATLTLCALSGLGGVGKTTLATEFAYKYQQFYDFVYWMEGGTKKDFIFSCESLLKRFNVSISKQKEDGEHAYFFKVINLLNRTLSTSEQQWLLIVDNIEEPELVADFAPSRGHVLYTSRNRDWLKKLEIDVFKPWESVAYLLQMTQKMTCFDKSPEEAMTLAIELEHLPLALAQAVAYINMQRLSSFAEYLAHYQASQAELLARKQIQSSLNGKYGREAIVMTTWNTTMQHMSVKTQQFMRYIAYVNPSNIQLKLFDELDSLNDITTQLNEYSMIKIDESKIGLGKIVSLHRLVQSVERLNHKKERKTDHLIDSLLHNWIDSWNKKGEKNGLIPGRVSGKYSSDLTALNALAIFSSSHVLSIKNHIEELIEKGEGYDRLMEKWKTLDSLINMRKKMFAAIICMLKVSGCKLPEFLNKGTLLSSSTMKEVSAYFYQKYPKGIKYKSCEEKTKFYWTAPNGVRKIFRELHVDDSQGNCGFSAIGIDRSDAIQLLIANAEDESTQQLIAPEIRALIINPEENSLLPPILQSLRAYFCHERSTFVEQLEVQCSVLNESLGLVGEESLTFEEMREYLNVCQDHYTWAQLFNENLVRLQQINRDIEAFSPTAEQLNAFVRYEFELKNGYLSYFRGGGGVLEAIARLRGTEVIVFEGDADLIQTLYIPSGDNSNHRYFLHHVGGVDVSGRILLTHFNLLEEVT